MKTEFIIGQKINSFGVIYLGDELNKPKPYYKAKNQRTALFKCFCGKEFRAPICRVLYKNGTCGCRRGLLNRTPYKFGTKINDSGIYFLKDIKSEIVGKQKRRMCLFICSCGKKFKARMARVKNNQIKDCGCGIFSKTQKHGLTGTKIRRCWKGLIARCYKPGHISYKNYGGRGIIVYEPWLQSLLAFYNYVNKLPHYGEPKMSLDRINNEGNYEPGNLRWVTAKVQANNRRKAKTRNTINN